MRWKVSDYDWEVNRIREAIKKKRIYIKRYNDTILVTIFIKDLQSQLYNYGVTNDPMGTQYERLYKEFNELYIDAENVEYETQKNKEKRLNNKRQELEEFYQKNSLYKFFQNKKEKALLTEISDIKKEGTYGSYKGK